MRLNVFDTTGITTALEHRTGVSDVCSEHVFQRSESLKQATLLRIHGELLFHARNVRLGTIKRVGNRNLGLKRGEKKD